MQYIVSIKYIVNLLNIYVFVINYKKHLTVDQKIMNVHVIIIKTFRCVETLENIVVYVASMSNVLLMIGMIVYVKRWRIKKEIKRMKRIKRIKRIKKSFFN